jgi:hypothetical protein
VFRRCSGKADGLNCTGRRIHGVPGYHASYGELSKCTLEASVFNSSMLPHDPDEDGSQCDLNRWGLIFLTGGFEASDSATADSSLVVAPHRQG